MDGMEFVVGLGSFTVFVCVVIYFVIRAVSNKEPKTEKSPIQPDDDHHKKVEKHESPKLSSKPKKGHVEKRKEIKDQFNHPWLVSNLKGHSGQILDMEFSSNGKYLASCADDRSVMLWTVKTFSDKNHKSVRANIEYDHATRVKWSPDGKAFIVSVANGNTIQVHRVGKKKDGTLGNIEVILTFPGDQHSTDVIAIGISCNGLFIMTCSSDTSLVVWDLKGQVLAVIDTLHINNYYACVSPCGRFVASSGFVSDVRVWEVCFSKTGDFKEVKRAFELKGHSSGVYNFSFSNDSSRMVTLSKDGTWKLWDTNIEYNKGQEPYLLRSCSYASLPDSLIALSPDGRTISVCTKSTISIYSAVNGEMQAKLEEIHPDPIKSLMFSPDGHYILAAAGRHIRIFNNTPGYKNLILGLEEAKRTASSQTMK